VNGGEKELEVRGGRREGKVEVKVKAKEN